MSTEQSAILEKIVFIALIASLFADIVLRPSWNNVYFTFGIPIFVMRIPVSEKYKGSPHQYLLEEEFQSNWIAPPITFKANDPHSFFFREKYFQIPLRMMYLPIMHGVLIFDHEKKQVVVKGIANWFPLWLILYIVLDWLNLSELLPFQIVNSTTIIILLLGIFYTIQYFLFSKVGKFSAQLCSNKVFLNSGGV